MDSSFDLRILRSFLSLNSLPLLLSKVWNIAKYRFKLDDHLQVPFFPMTLFITVAYPTEKELKYHFRMLSEIWHNLDEKRVKFSESVQLYMHEVAQDQSNQSKLFLYSKNK
ncbi:hypothetical protein T06_532 [Trichinella sp. T6]|nr:hypothetical protein T06_532 [Trichinella sp. T6]